MKPGINAPFWIAALALPAAFVLTGCRLAISPPVARIVFCSTRDEPVNGDIFVMRENGDLPVNLTHDQVPGNPTDRQPAVSPDGSKIAFVSDRAGNDDIYVMEADGSHAVTLTIDSNPESEPQWSPDGTQVLFFRQNVNEICVVNAEGRSPAVSLASGSAPRWSPDGKKIVCVMAGLIQIMDADGTHQAPLPNPYASDNEPVWSPDGNRIAFIRIISGSSEIFVKNIDGSDTIQLTDNGMQNISPAWSPNGRQIVYRSSNGTMVIWVVDADGSGGPRRLTDLSVNVFNPRWASDGGSIIFDTDAAGNREIFMLPVTGGAPLNLTRNPSIDEFPIWCAR